MKADQVDPSAVTYTLLISAASRKGKSGDLDAAAGFFQGMLEARLQPQAITFNALISAAARAGNTSAAESWFSAMREQSAVPTTPTFNALIQAHAEAGDVSSAEVYLEELGTWRLRHDEASFGPLLNRYVSKAEELYARMAKSHIRPSIVAYGQLLHCYASADPPESARAEEALRWMVGMGVRPNPYVLNSFLRAVGSRRARKVCIELGLNPDFLHGRPSVAARERRSRPGRQKGER